MAIDFPNSPTVGDIFNDAGKYWRWDGTSWDIYTNDAQLYTHGSTHGVAGNDPVTVAQSQVTGLSTALSGKASTTHATTHSSGGSDEITGIAPTSITGTAVVDSDTRLITYCTSSTRPGSPVEGQIIYETDTNVYYGWKGAAWLPIGGGATGGGTDDVFYENSKTVTADYTITSGKNAISAGPITVNSGVNVTVPSGSTWVVA